jgi:broad specificity phosphatase PhoE
VLVLVRHGRTDVNARGLLLGRLDPPVDELGLVQAEQLAMAIEKPDRVVSSPLLRARQTAEAFGLPVEVDDRWIELDYGELDGQPVSSVGSEVWKRWRTDLRFTPPGGESIHDMSVRVLAACEDLVDEVAERDVVVVSHVSPIKAAVTWALGVGTETGWRTHLDAASISRIVIAPQGPLLRSFNETGHLGRPPGPVRIHG